MDYYGLIRATIVYVETHAREGVDCAKLAQAMGYSEPHLRDVFRRRMGMPLVRYIASRRVANAAFSVLYEPDNLLDISLRYGYESYDTFTRVFRRVAGHTPSEFRRLRPHIERRAIGGGVYGIDIARGASKDEMERMRTMNEERRTLREAHSTVLYGVPKAHYGAYGGCTPYPISLKACANYLGEDIDYADAIVGCGAAFRLTWDTTEWNGGNVDVFHTFDEEDYEGLIYARGVEALGRASRLLIRKPETTKDEVRAFLKAALDEGVPVIAMGMVGPPEAGIVTGYRDDGNAMLGWSVFQDFSEYNATIQIDESGYYVTDRWWENGVDTLIAMGERTGEKLSPEAAVVRAIAVLRPRMFHQYAKGTLAYDAWREALANDDDFREPQKAGEALEPANELRPEGGEEMMLPKIAWQLMCHDDALDCLSDGRANAAKYFNRLAGRDPRYGKLAARFQEVADIAMEMFRLLGGWERGEAQMRALGEKEVRVKLCACIERAKAADMAALELLNEIAQG